MKMHVTKVFFAILMYKMSLDPETKLIFGSGRNILTFYSVQIYSCIMI